MSWPAPAQRRLPRRSPERIPARLGTPPPPRYLSTPRNPHGIICFCATVFVVRRRCRVVFCSRSSRFTSFISLLRTKGNITEDRTYNILVSYKSYDDYYENSSNVSQIYYSKKVCLQDVILYKVTFHILSFKYILI